MPFYLYCYYLLLLYTCILFIVQTLMPLASTVHYHSEHCLNLITTLIMHSIMIREQEI